MDAAIRSILASAINEISATNARRTGTATATGDDGAPAGTGAEPNPPAVAGTEEQQETERIRAGLNQMSGRLHMWLPIAFIVILKLFLDNFIAGAALIVSFSCYYRLKQAFELQLALKERCSRTTLAGLLLFGVGLFCCILLEIERFDYSGNFFDRLMFRPIPKEETPTLLETLWSCGITDGIVHILVLCAKILAVNVTGLYTQFQSGDLQRARCCKRRGALQDSAYGDLESGGASLSLGNATAARALQALSSLDLASWGSSITGLVRRQAGLGGSYSAVPQQASASSSSALHGEAAAVGDGVNSSDGSDNGQSSKHFLLNVRICSLIEMVGLVYRSALPVAWWVAYFRTTLMLATLLQVMYVAIKFYEIGSKASGAAYAVVMLFTNKIEFGHYSTPEELRGREDGACECPVCFDNPTRPVTLNCQHIFCEVCIFEWLDKEQTCPVCRAQVEFCSPLLHSVKTEASSALPIFA